MKIDVINEIQELISDTILKPDGPLCVDIKVPYPPIWDNFTTMLQSKVVEWDKKKIVDEVIIDNEKVSIILKQDSAVNNFRRIYSTKYLFENTCRLRVLKLKNKKQKTNQQD